MLAGKIWRQPLPERCRPVTLGHRRMFATSLDRRLLVVLLAGGAIAAVCAWRISANRSADYNAVSRATMLRRRAPGFEASDAQNQMFRLERYLGRHRVLVVFVPGEADPVRTALRLFDEHQEDLQRQDIKVVVLSPALPQQHRAWIRDVGESPVAVLTDLQGEIAREWGVLNVTKAIAFVVDRKGEVAWSGIAPLPTDDLAQILNQRQSGRVSQ